MVCSSLNSTTYTCKVVVSFINARSLRYEQSQLLSLIPICLMRCNSLYSSCILSTFSRTTGDFRQFTCPPSFLLIQNICALKWRKDHKVGIKLSHSGCGVWNWSPYILVNSYLMSQFGASVKSISFHGIRAKHIPILVQPQSRPYIMVSMLQLAGLCMWEWQAVLHPRSISCRVVVDLRGT